MLNLSNEQKALFSLLGSDFEISKDTDWKRVETEAASQAVYLLAANSDKLPTNVAFGRKLQYVASNMRSLHAITELDNLMKKHNFKYVILKGLSAASYYPDYMNRILGDCDFLIELAEVENVKKVLLEAGYEMSGEGHVHHITFKKPGQDLEMHFEIAGIPIGVLGDYVREYIKYIFDNTISFNTQNHKISLPAPKYHGIVLLLHMQNHMSSDGMGLRHLMDWCVFVDKIHNEQFWDEELLPLIKKIGMFKYAQVMTKTGGMYLNTACPKWAENADEKLCDEIMQDILTGGNFGRKNKEKSAAGMMMSKPNEGKKKRGYIVNLWNNLIAVVKVRHKNTLEKYPFLYPVFMMKYVVRRIYRVCIGKRASLLKSSKYVNERKSVYDRLEIFEVK